MSKAAQRHTTSIARRALLTTAAAAVCVMALPISASPSIPEAVIALGPEWSAKWLMGSPAFRSFLVRIAALPDDQIVVLDDLIQAQRTGAQR